jgi:hypothetical protein
MATRINRRRLVSTVNPFENAEGVIPLKFTNLELFKLVDADQTNRRNELPQAKFTIINPTNGDVVGVMAQCQIREQVLAAFAAKESGKKVTVKSVNGARASKGFLGMTTIFAKDIDINIEEMPAPEVAAAAAPATQEQPAA